MRVWIVLLRSIDVLLIWNGFSERSFGGLRWLVCVIPRQFDASREFGAVSMYITYVPLVQILYCLFDQGHESQQRISYVD